MIKELSKQICEICGIKPETITVHRGFTKKEVEALFHTRKYKANNQKGRVEE